MRHMKALTLEIITGQFIHNTFRMQREIKTVMNVPQVHVKHVSFNESRKQFEHRYTLKFPCCQTGQKVTHDS